MLLVIMEISIEFYFLRKHKLIEVKINELENTHL